MNLLFKLGMIAEMLLAAIAGNSQSKSYKIYESYGNEDGFSYFTFSKSMIDAIDLNLDDENKRVTGDLREIRVMVYNPAKGKLKSNFADEMSLRLKGMNYQKTEPKDAGDDGEFWIEGNGKKVKECHVVIRNNEKNSFGCLVSFYGDFTVDELSKFEKFSKKQLE